MIHVVAIVTTKPGKRPEVLEIFNANVPAVRAEAGCIEYGAAIDWENADPAFGPDVFLAIEKWESREALRAHAASAHMAVYVKDTAGLVDSVKVHVLGPASN